MSKYADKKIQAACAWSFCDQLEPATELVVRRGVLDWFCKTHAELARLEKQ